MKIYLVGGAVRDQLLGLPIKERDWVVVGGQPELMLSQGYQQVGHDFPVFLHPTTHEEYALARIERKRSPGYYGFVCDTSSKVTLEEDLARRDLTINAMAMDDHGQLIDPYHGQADLEHKILRHVSAAFVEDPVRVLRVARFLARFHHLGFRLAPETKLLMKAMVRNGELAHLVAERGWQEWEQGLSEKNPELFINTLRECGALEVVIPEVHALFGIPNKNSEDKNVDSGMHSVAALSVAATMSNDPLVRFATLILDVGKTITPMVNWPCHPGYEQLGVTVIDNLCQRLRIPKRYQKAGSQASLWHWNISNVGQLSPEAVVSVFDKMDAYREVTEFERLLKVSEANYLAGKKGRFIETSPNDYPQAQLWRIMLSECQKISAKAWVDQGLVGLAIKEALHDARVACVSNLKQFHNI